MPNGNKPTREEHYLPKYYLKGFSEIGRRKALIWGFDIKSMHQIPTQVDTEDICRKTDLYELKDKDSKFISQNRIEKRVGTVIETIIAKSENEKCLECWNVLSDEDKSLLVILMTMLKYRDPDTISFGIKVLQKENSLMEEREARNFTLLNLLPLGIDSGWDENTIIRTAVEQYSGMAFQIGVASDDVIITSDRPIIEWPPHEKELYNRPGAVVFPLMSRLVLFMFPIETCHSFGGNCFFKLTEEQINDIQT